ncbi:MAG: MoxR family ATPase [Actinomycetia bacterium]|nr:MoxR family ATPase [Actinomycetes bacterium]
MKITDSSEAQRRIEALRANIEGVIRGKKDTVKLAVIALLSNGQLLVEDVPGVGKTMLARAMARSIDASFQRIQFTPDLLPSDVTGASVFNQKTGEFEFQPGPIFANIILIDEINRTTPRTQSSLLEAMDEHQVTVDGRTHRLPDPFFVVATQNPVEFYGTYPLPEGQRDRFMMSVGLGYPSFEVEKEIANDQMKRHPIEKLEPVMTAGDIKALQSIVRDVHIDQDIMDYIVSLVHATRNHPALLLGASPRGSLALVRTSQASAIAAARDFVVPDDVKQMAKWVLPHRFISRQRSQTSLHETNEIMAEVLEEVPVPIEASERRGDGS